MYRETLLGGALAQALAELQQSWNLSQDQIDTVWQTFDRTYDRTLQDATSFADKVTMRCQTARPTSSSSAEVPTAEASTTVSSGNQGGSVDEADLFPLYRVCDGVWTIVLKDVQLDVVHEGKKETLRLDYLKCYLKEMEANSGPQGDRQKHHGRRPKRTR